MISLGQLVDIQGRALKVWLCDDHERLELDDGSDRSAAATAEEGPMTLELADLLCEREPWQGAGQRVHRGRFVFGIYINDEERDALRERYLALKDSRRSRPSALA